ncbi:MAG: hypothetical protein JNL32_07615 [Candidatus Kapabacteria bacterium]|nr:hypothetical protein [Candidatus Kapabacteria bacterium]
MAYPLLYKWSLTLKYSNTNNVAGASSITLYPAGIYAKREAVGKETEFLGGVIEHSALRRRTFTLPLMPFIYPDHVVEFNELEQIILGSKYFWLSSNGITYPETLTNVAVTRTGYEVSDEDDGTQRMTLNFKGRSVE